MILPIYAYGQPVLRKKAEEIDFNDQDLIKLISDMFDTMYDSNGIGLAAPLIGKSIRLFIVYLLKKSTVMLRGMIKGRLFPLCLVGYMSIFCNLFSLVTA